MAKHFQGRPSRTLTLNDAIQIHRMLRDGWSQARIAAHFDVNQGRISEVKNGKAWATAYKHAFG